MRAFFRLIWKEIYDLCAKPVTLAALLAFAFLIVWAAGKLNVEQPPIRVVLHSEGVAPDQLKKARDVLSEFSNVVVNEVADNYVDEKELSGSVPVLIVVNRSGHWVVLHRLPTIRREEEIVLVANLISASLETGQPWLASVLNSAIDKTQEAVPINARVGRFAALPGDAQLLLVPRTVALIIIFLPFVFAVRTYTRETLFRTLPTLIIAPTAGWMSIIGAKAVVCTGSTVFVLLFLLLTIRPFFGLVPKPGLATELMIQSLAIFVSACMGLLAAMIARNRSQVYVVIAAYLLGLMLLSGFFFPLDSAARIIRLGSYLSPLTFGGRLLEDWMFYGSPAASHPREIIALLAQGIVAVALLAATTWYAKQRI